MDYDYLPMKTCDIHCTLCYTLVNFYMSMESHHFPWENTLVTIAVLNYQSVITVSSVMYCDVPIEHGHFPKWAAQQSDGKYDFVNRDGLIIIGVICNQQIWEDTTKVIQLIHCIWVYFIIHKQDLFHDVQGKHRWNVWRSQTTKIGRFHPSGRRSFSSKQLERLEKS